MMQRRRRGAGLTGIALLWVGVGVATVLAGCTSPGWWPVPDSEISVPADAIQMTVVSITDGDTLKLRTDQPGDLVTTTDPIAVRLIGIDTPEVYPTLECFGTEAEAELARLAPVGSTLRVGGDLDTWDDYGRRLFYLWAEDGTFINLALVEGGFAEAIRVAPNDAHYDALLDAERDATSTGLGMWGAC